MPRDKTGRRESCGNAGAVESVESQKQASPSFHEPLGNLAKRRRDSHIPTAPATKADGKVENQKQVSHFSTAANLRFLKPKNKTRGGLRPPPARGRPPFGRQLITGKINERSHRAATTLSGSPRIGIEEPFQAHRPLESIFDFRLISGLENAP